jgi:hypothetical protein
MTLLAIGMTRAQQTTRDQFDRGLLVNRAVAGELPTPQS